MIWPQIGQGVPKHAIPWGLLAPEAVALSRGEPAPGTPQPPTGSPDELLSDFTAPCLDSPTHQMRKKTPTPTKQVLA